MESLDGMMKDNVVELGMPTIAAPKVPDNEKLRLKRIREYGIAEAEDEPLDNIVSVVSSVCETPIALVSIVDIDKQWFKAKVGLGAGETSREVSFCAHAINSPNETFIVEDATKDERFSNNPLVTSSPNIRAYAGVPLISPEGLAFGTLCAIDTKPRAFTSFQQKTLELLAKQVMTELNLRHYVKVLVNSVDTADKLLENILPGSVVGRLKRGEIIADNISCASILFADLKGFTEYSAKISASELVYQIGILFNEIDRASIEQGICKIKTIGDCYMAAAG